MNYFPSAGKNDLSKYFQKVDAGGGEIITIIIIINKTKQKTIVCAIYINSMIT